MTRNRNSIKYVSRNIRSLRVKSGLSVKDAANRLGVCTSTLSKIENGITDINLSRLQQIADLYKYNLEQLWTLDFDNQEANEAKLNIAKKRVLDLESEIAGFQRKIILLYEKLRQQSADVNAVHI